MKLRFVVLVLLLSLRAACAYAEGGDGFGSATQIQGEHFTIYYKAGVEASDLLQRLKISPADQILSDHKIDTSSADRELSSMVELLFIRAGDILDMHVYSYKGSIKIFPSVRELTDYYNQRYHTHVPCTGYAFYLVEDKSIYISAENFSREVLGHEIGHAVMSSYFVVQPSVKAQEVLAGYVEYQLRKSR